MPYVALADISGRIPTAFLAQALDDDNDGVIDAWDGVAESVGSYIDGILGTRFTVPFESPFPPVVTTAAQVLACEMCYQRRGVSAEQNPWTAQANAIRGVLMKVAEGKAPLAPDKQRAKPSGVLIKEESRLYDAAGRRLS